MQSQLCLAPQSLSTSIAEEFCSKVTQPSNLSLNYPSQPQQYKSISRINLDTRDTQEEDGKQSTQSNLKGLQSQSMPNSMRGQDSGENRASRIQKDKFPKDVYYAHGRLEEYGDENIAIIEFGTRPMPVTHSLENSKNCPESYTSLYPPTCSSAILPQTCKNLRPENELQTFSNYLESTSSIRSSSHLEVNQSAAHQVGNFTSLPNEVGTSFQNAPNLMPLLGPIQTAATTTSGNIGNASMSRTLSLLQGSSYHSIQHVPQDPSQLDKLQSQQVQQVDFWEFNDICMNIGSEFRATSESQDFRSISLPTLLLNRQQREETGLMQREGSFSDREYIQQINSRNQQITMRETLQSSRPLLSLSSLNLTVNSQYSLQSETDDSNAMWEVEAHQANHSIGGSPSPPQFSQLNYPTTALASQSETSGFSQMSSQSLQGVQPICLASYHDFNGL
ncbi:hypothetical protein FGO68_gene7640 [Halteria grandinella]|uniref:Uncharacterized protein n=1 Tax=Halteria grandinella TaxID=5974 RepID=A0A8J8NZ70_HALGN|nr:hypothetical protein FGO68_gene7640 [Halteria grandinella]